MSKKFKAPVDNEDFKFYWNIFVDDVTKRENFKQGHLQQLRILCKLYTDFDKLSEQIDKEGFTYETDPNGESRYGSQIKVNPACTLRDKTLMEIRQYSKLLKLELLEDKEMNEAEKIRSEWD